MPWIAAQKMETKRFTMAEGMPIPYQGHTGFRKQLQEAFGQGCIVWQEEVGLDQLRKIETELTILRKENTQLKAKLSQRTKLNV